LRRPPCLDDRRIPHRRTVPVAPAGAPGLRAGSSSVDVVSCPGQAAHPRLGVEPLGGAHQLSFPGGVLSFLPIGEGTASPTDGHSSVGLGEMVIIKTDSQFLRFR
jgi:hypothetical protein